MTAAGIVLAGGASTRFGRDKLAAPLDGRPLVHHAIAAVATVADPVVVVLAPETTTDSLPAGVVVARDPVPHQGPLAGLAAGLAALSATGADRVIVVAGDMPSLVPAVLRALLDALDGPAGPTDAARLETAVAAPLPLAMRTAAAPAVAATLATGRRALRAVLDALDVVVVPETDWRALDPEGATLRDIDTPGELAGR